MYVTWAGVICLMHAHAQTQDQAAHEPKGMQHPRVNVDISGMSLLPMSQCYRSPAELVTGFQQNLLVAFNNIKF